MPIVSFRECLISSLDSMIRLTIKLKAGHPKTKQWSSMISSFINAFDLADSKMND